MRMSTITAFTPVRWSVSTRCRQLCDRPTEIAVCSYASALQSANVRGFMPRSHEVLSLQTLSMSCRPYLRAHVEQAGPTMQWWSALNASDAVWNICYRTPPSPDRSALCRPRRSFLRTKRRPALWMRWRPRIGREATLMPSWPWSCSRASATPTTSRHAHAIC